VLNWKGFDPPPSTLVRQLFAAVYQLLKTLGVSWSANREPDNSLLGGSSASSSIERPHAAQR
jgi:hypothetical protein